MHGFKYASLTALAGVLIRNYATYQRLNRRQHRPNLLALMATTPFRSTIALRTATTERSGAPAAWGTDTWKFQMSWHEIALSNSRNYE
jgi:hypothetical protein